YLDLLQIMTSMNKGWASVLQIDQSFEGNLPRVNLSVKISSLYPRFDPLDPDTEEVVRERLRPLFREAARLKAALIVDMEQSAFKDLTLAIFRDLLEESEFRSGPTAAVPFKPIYGM